MQTRTTFSVIVPMHNAAATIERCLAPLSVMLCRGEITEIIVVDDGSIDGSNEIAARDPAVRLVRTGSRAGPGAARNHGARLASGSHLWFVDADVVVADDCARVLSRAFAESAAGAVFGCYDDAPAASNFLSQYKNLAHRYYHRRGKTRASTFWAGCGAIEHSLFDELRGFDARRYPWPSIEDIELGYRMVDSGRRIVLRHDLQCKHLKEWRLANLLHADIVRRALPWSRLMLERRRFTDDLNVGMWERGRALLALGVLLALFAWPPGFVDFWVPAAALAVSVLANLELIRFFHAARGPFFAARAFLYHQLYYVYSLAAFACAAMQHLRSASGAGSNAPGRFRSH
jgi:glycosyltransferase involved in cell wall biosynthesis